MKLLVLMLAIVFSTGTILGEFRGFLSPGEMIAKSEFIAVVTIHGISYLDKSDRPMWDYGQRARGTVELNAKGDLPPEIEIYADENFICQQTSLQPGRYLLFLNRDGHGKLRASNYQMSVRPIKGNAVEWYFDAQPVDPAHYKFVWKRLERILKQVKSAAPTPAA